MTQTVSYNTDTSDMLIPHGMFRSALSNPAPIVEHATAKGGETLAAASSYFDNVLRFLDAHHGGEDAIVWPVLTERCASARDLIERMEGQHGNIHELRAAAGSALSTWESAPSTESGDAFITALRALQTEVEEHFQQEERDILPLASAHMSPEEWGALPGHAMAHFTGDKIWLILGLIFEQMNEEQLAFTFTLLPPPVVDMWKQSGSAAFAEFMGRIRPAA